MVAPMNSEHKRGSKTKRIVGDGKRIVLRTNSDSLLIIGSGNLLEIERNDGDIQVVGDGCKVCVNSGCGTIKYTGDGGFLQTGNIALSNITYEGDGGKIVQGDGTTKTCHKTKSRNYSSCENLKKSGDPINVINKTNCSFSVPTLKNIGCIHVHVPIPKISVKCKHRTM